MTKKYVTVIPAMRDVLISLVLFSLYISTMKNTIPKITPSIKAKVRSTAIC